MTSPNSWLAMKDFNTINSWTLDECLLFLKLSESTQKNLPNVPRGSIYAVKAYIGKLARSINPEGPMSTARQKFEAVTVSALNDYMEVLRFLYPNLNVTSIQLPSRTFYFEIRETLTRASNMLQEVQQQKYASSAAQASTP